jgi:hypothetical protein
VYIDYHVVCRVKHAPDFYVNNLLLHIDAIDRQRRKKEKKKKLPIGLEPADALLKGLEISLRTNSLAFVPAVGGGGGGGVGVRLSVCCCFF